MTLIRWIKSLIRFTEVAKKKKCASSTEVKLANAQHATTMTAKVVTLIPILLTPLTFRTF